MDNSLVQPTVPDNCEIRMFPKHRPKIFREISLLKSDVYSHCKNISSNQLFSRIRLISIIDFTEFFGCEVSKGWKNARFSLTHWKNISSNQLGVRNFFIFRKSNIFLSLRFYVKSIVEILEVLKLQFFDILETLNFDFLVIFMLHRVQKFI